MNEIEITPPTRFTYRTRVVDGVEFDDEFVVIANGVELGTIRRRRGTTDGYWGAWAAGTDLFETKRQAAMRRWEQHVTEDAR